MGLPAKTKDEPLPIPRSHILGLVLLALGFTLLDAVKPLTVDDAAYYYYAVQIAEHPLDPYGFEVFWWDQPLPANDVLAPPLLPYWWAAAIRLFGDAPFLWKLWLLPFSLLFAGALYFLARRFARGLEMPLVTLTLLSPTFLPGLNLMLDIPALALGLAALNVFFRACDRDRVTPAVLAGLLAGLAMQTKYTAFLAPAVMVLYAGLKRRQAPALALVAVSVAVTLFAAWEWTVLAKYGESHFAHHFRAHGSREPLLEVIRTKLNYFGIPGLTTLGGVAPTLAVLGLAALGRRRLGLLAAGAVVAAYALVAATDGRCVFNPAETWPWLPGRPADWEQDWTLAQAVFTVLGLGLAAVLAAVVVRETGLMRGGWRPERWGAHAAAWFLVLWLGLEVAGFFALTPFLAVRRVMGIVVVATLLVGHLAAQNPGLPGWRRWLVGTVAGTAALGLLIALVDLGDSCVERQAAEDAARFVRAAAGPDDGSRVVWFVGHWGFQHYAERAGMVPIEPDVSELRAGDWVVAPDIPTDDGGPGVTQQIVKLRTPGLQPVTVLAFQDPVPLHTIMGYYGTARGAPLQHLDGPRLRVTVYRVRRDFTAAAK